MFMMRTQIKTNGNVKKKSKKYTNIPKRINYQNSLKDSSCRSMSELLKKNIDQFYLSFYMYLIYFSNVMLIKIQIMQLQILKVETSQNNKQRSDQKIKTKPYSFLFDSQVKYEITKQIQTQLKQIQQSNKAYTFYLNKLKRKALNVFYQLDYQSEIQLMQRAFLGFKYEKLEVKVLKKQKLLFYSDLFQFHDEFIEKKNKRIKAIQHYDKKLKKIIFQQMQHNVILSKKIKILEQNLKIQRKQEFIMHLQENYDKKIHKKKQIRQINQLIEQIYQKNILKKYFAQFLIAKKYFKLQKFLKSHYINKIFFKINLENNQNSKLVKKFKQIQQNKLKRLIFQVFKQNIMSKHSIQYNQKRIKKKYFRFWIQFNQEKQNQKQINQVNQIILKHYLEIKLPEKNNQLFKNCFSQWKIWTGNQKARKYEEKIIKNFADIKYKQILLRKYFQVLKQNQLIQKVKRFYNKKLKAKVFDSFRIFLIKQSKKLENYVEFVEKRSIKKYFDSIKQFNKNEEQKIYTFLLKKYWIKFTEKITQGYLQKIYKADNYYQTLLKFKTVYIWRQNILLNQKACYLAHYLNIVKPFKIWFKGYTIRKFIRIKELFLMKKIFFEMKIQTIRKQNSQQKIRYFDIHDQQLKTQTIDLMVLSKNKDVEFDKIQIKSPQFQTSFFHHIQSNISLVQNTQKSKQSSQSQQQQDQIQRKLDSLFNKIRNKNSIK